MIYVWIYNQTNVRAYILHTYMFTSVNFTLTHLKFRSCRSLGYMNCRTQSKQNGRVQIITIHPFLKSEINLN